MNLAERERIIARIARNDGPLPAGVGFVVGRRTIVTCAHVVNTALGRSLLHQDRPTADELVTVLFPLLPGDAGAQTRRFRVAAWQPPPRTGLIGGDVAGLVCDRDLPPGVRPARLARRGDQWGQDVLLFGFPGNPPRQDRGAWTGGSLRGVVGQGALQVDHATEAALRAQPGYSGSPLIVRVDGQDRVVGMLSVASADDRVRDAYAQSVFHLSGAWPRARLFSSHPDAEPGGHAAFVAAVRSIVSRAPADARLRSTATVQPGELQTIRHKFGIPPDEEILYLRGKMGIFFNYVALVLTSYGIRLVRDAAGLGPVLLPYADLVDTTRRVRTVPSKNAYRRVQGFYLDCQAREFSVYTPDAGGAESWERLGEVIDQIRSMMTDDH
ncbi:trypsin-like serine peptidase [Micromonospora sp. NPDC049497]|uniref:trypsin-like serine peptidase n=1 Tax=Micromonospora sp. NPDC049497 TaxID=3364273 RepID=UPI0037B96E82